MWIVITYLIIFPLLFLLLFLLYRFNFIRKETVEILSWISGICGFILSLLVAMTQNNQQNHSELSQLPEHSSSGKSNAEIAPTSKSISGPQVVKLSELNDKAVCDLVRESKKDYDFEGGIPKAQAYGILNQALDLAKKQNFPVNLEKAEEARKIWATGEENPEKVLSSYREAFVGCRPNQWPEAKPP